LKNKCLNYLTFIKHDLNYFNFVIIFGTKANIKNMSFNQNDISHTDNIADTLKVFLRKRSGNKTAIITDSNCHKLCLPIIKKVLPENTGVFILNPGENYKTVKSVIEIWDFFTENNIERDSLIINLGGGIVTDTGGFAASTFKRGVPFINIPTSLLAQTDASAGGKTGINFKGLKNEIGTFTLPEQVFISDIFLKTLPDDEFLSGFGEMLKHALIFDKSHYKELILFIKKDFPEKNYKNLQYLIRKSVNIKIHFVKNDFKEKGLRKTLNFGHTFGHALESLYAQKKHSLKHGVCIAYGIICELMLSVKHLGFDKKSFYEISKDIFDIYGKINIREKDFEKIYEYMRHDKKNKNEKIRCVLLRDAENPEINRIISKTDIFESLRFFNELSSEM